MKKLLYVSLFIIMSVICGCNGKSIDKSNIDLAIKQCENNSGLDYIESYYNGQGVYCKNGARFSNQNK